MSEWLERALLPDWPVPLRVRALMTTRLGGVSKGSYCGLNLGDHVGDVPADVAANRALVSAELPGEPVWLSQVHGITVIDADREAGTIPRADASVAFLPHLVCAVLTADCLPVLFARMDGKAVGVAHAGWRGLSGGVLETTVKRLGPADQLVAWLGPAIGPTAFEVGDEVRDAFIAKDSLASNAFLPGVERGKWWADIYLLAKQRLAAIGVTQVYGGGLCTVGDADRFFSYRRDRSTGRMAALIWLEA